MGKKYIIVFFLAVLSSAVFAQNVWPADDAVWYFDHEECMTFSNLTRYNVSGTEVILDVECTVLHGKLYYLNYAASLEYDWYIYFNGDTLFWLFEGSFYPLLCFNLEVGDTWNPLPVDHPSIDEQCVFSPMEVKEKSMV